MGLGKKVMTHIIVSNRPWNLDMTSHLQSKTGEKFFLISQFEDLTFEKIKKIDPLYIFIPHWSYAISKDIYENYECVIFHMTDLPYGRGGSPLQNLIVRGHETTIITALKCVKEIDTGPVYLKKPLSLLGSAEEIFLRASMLIEDMVCQILKKDLVAIEQEGTPTEFKRRKPEQGDWSKLQRLDEVFNHIRMLDANGYPPAFVRVGRFKLEFTRASRRTGSIISDVRILLEDNNE